MKTNFKDKTVLVAGIGRSGIAAAEALLQQGAKVTLYDKKEEKEMDVDLLKGFLQKGASLCLGRDPEAPASFDYFIVSPGIPLDLPFVEAAAAAGTEIISEVELAWQLSDCNFAAITGTNGKTTTTTLTGEIFKAAGLPTEIVGNIGVAVVPAAMAAPETGWMVTECSSFQLEPTKTFRPHVAALLNITPDHLNRHKTMENYAAAKKKIYANQNKSDYFIVNYDDPGAWAAAEGCPATVVPFSRKEELEFGCFVRHGRIVVAPEKDVLVDICGTDEVYIPGNHNLENALAATGLAYFAGVEPGVIARLLRDFQGVEHRMEFSGEIDGVRFVNDSKGTNPDASIKAVEAIPGGILLIAGGYDKKSSFGGLIDAFGGKVKTMFLMGVTAPQIRDEAKAKGFENSVMCKDMEDCVRRAFEQAEPGDTVLLSPACASWDMYSCFEERGEDFKNCVKHLK